MRIDEPREDGGRARRRASTAMIAATIDGSPSTTQDAVRFGSYEEQDPDHDRSHDAPGPPAGASRSQGYVARAVCTDRPDVPVAVRRKYRPTARTAPDRRLAAPATRALLYSGRPRNERDGPANQEVSDRACMAHRPSREATERPTTAIRRSVGGATRESCLLQTGLGLEAATPSVLAARLPLMRSLCRPPCLDAHGADSRFADGAR